ncbi:MAG: ATP-binding protein, partial [Prevotellaceae bacterium]|nr:ATP-binding protein [Prevotellaceae bacterium]
VIRIDWSHIDHETIEDIETDLTAVLKLKAKNFGITLTRKRAASCLDELIEQTSLKTGKQVVILIDEYDVPILDAIGKSSREIEAMQKALHNIYKVMKGSDNYIKFIFLTGVSKFAGLSIFSALNNPKDITLSEKYATICGITQEELESNFPEYLDATANKLSITREDLLSEIRKWYNGYSWDGKISVYNPFSVLQFLDEMNFKSYWFATGTPTFLITLLKKRNSVELFLQPIQASEAVFSSYDPNNLETLPLLFQTGYLTVKEITIDDNHKLIYTFGPPNDEVREAFIAHLAQAYTEVSMDEMVKLQKDMQRQLKTGDSEGLEQSLRAMIAHVPYQLHVESEKYYHSLLLVWFYFLGFKPLGELSTNIGRIDAVWKLPGMNIVTEIKYSVDQPLDKLLDKASNQTRDRKYYEAFFDAPGKIVLVSIAFSGREPGCRIETLDN